MTLTVPYAPRRMYEPDGSIAELVRRAGQAQAEGIRRGGDISANMWGSLGQIGSQAVSDYTRQRAQQAEQKRMDDAAAAKAKAQEPILAEEAEQRRMNREKTQFELDEFNRKRERENTVSTALTQPGKGKAAILESVKGDPAVLEMVEKAFEKQSQGMRRIFGDAALNARTIGRDTPEGAFAALDSLEEDGIDPKVLAPIREEITKDPTSVPGIIDRLLSQHPDEEVRKLVREAPKAPEGFSLSPGQVRYDATGKPIASAPRAPSEPRVPSYTPKMIMVDGKEVQANYDASTGKYYDEDGKVLRGVGAAPTADMRNKVEGRKMVTQSISAIRDLSKEIITRVGPAQRAEALKRGVEAVFGTDPAFRTYQDARTALAGNLAVAQQGARPSDADIKSVWLPLVPDPYRDTNESAAMKWKLIDTMSNTGGGDAKPAHTRMSATNPKTGEKLYSDDGGATWHK